MGTDRIAVSGRRRLKPAEVEKYEKWRVREHLQSVHSRFHCALRGEGSRGEGLTCSSLQLRTDGCGCCRSCSCPCAHSGSADAQGTRFFKEAAFDEVSAAEQKRCVRTPLLIAFPLCCSQKRCVFTLRFHFFAPISVAAVHIPHLLSEKVGHTAFRSKRNMSTFTRIKPLRSHVHLWIDRRALVLSAAAAAAQQQLLLIDQSTGECLSNPRAAAVD